jgi:hypothetical protein
MLRHQAIPLAHLGPFALKQVMLPGTKYAIKVWYSKGFQLRNSKTSFPDGYYVILQLKFLVVTDTLSAQWFVS